MDAKPDASAKKQMVLNNPLSYIPIMAITPPRDSKHILSYTCILHLYISHVLLSVNMCIYHNFILGIYGINNKLQQWTTCPCFFSWFSATENMTKLPGLSSIKYYWIWNELFPLCRSRINDIFEPGPALALKGFSGPSIYIYSES